MIKKDLELHLSGGQRKRFSIEIGIPFKDDRCWCCPVNLPGLHDIDIKGICGEDPIQSLCLSLDFIKQLLKAEIEHGATIYEPSSENQWSPDLITISN